MTETAVPQFAPGDKAVWTGLSHQFERPVTITEVRCSYLVIFGETPADGEIVYDIHDPAVVKGTIFGIPAEQLIPAQDLPRPADPWACIPNADREYEGTVLELRTTARCDKALDTASEVCPRCFRQHTWLMED